MEVDQPPLCILCTKPCDDCDGISRITNEKWQNIESKSAGWSGLDKYGTAYETTRWENGPAGCYMHASCYTTLSNPVKLQQAKKKGKKSCFRWKRRKKRMWKQVHVVYTMMTKTCLQNADIVMAHYMIRRNACGVFPGTTKDTREESSANYPWYLHRMHGPNSNSTQFSLKMSMRSRIVTLINFVDSGTDPFAVEIRYHLECWLQYVSHPKLSDQDHLHLQNLILRKLYLFFFRHVKEVIFENHEIKTLQSLLKVYQKTLFNFNHDASGTKSSFIKTTHIHQ